MTIDQTTETLIKRFISEFITQFRMAQEGSHYSRNGTHHNLQQFCGNYGIHRRRRIQGWLLFFKGFNVQKNKRVQFAR